MCETLLRDPDAYRLVVLCLPSHEREHLKYSFINELGDKQDMLCVSIDEYVTDLVSAIRKGKNAMDFSKYTERQILLVDDLHFIKGKEQTQEYFYRILKQRLECGKTIVLFSEYGVDHLRRTFRDDLINYLNLGFHGEEE